LFRLSELKRLSVNQNRGIEAEFERISEEKIKEDIKENNEEVTRDRIIFYKDIERKIIQKVHERIGGELKCGIHFVYGAPDKPEFIFTPDGVIKLKNEMIFIEIKHIIHPELAEKIIVRSLGYLRTILKTFEPSAGTNLKAKLILASSFDIDVSRFVIPNNIDIEIFRL